MQDSKYFSLGEMLNSFIHANQRVLHNYLKNVSGYHHDLRDITSTYSELFTKMFVHPTDMIKIYSLNLDFLKRQQDVWGQVFLAANNGEIKEMIEPNKNDRRFVDSAWSNIPYFSFIKQNYLFLSSLSKLIINEIETDEKLKKKLNFYTGQYINALSPSNFVFTNPEVLKLAIETQGKSLYDGLNNLAKDLEKGRVSQTDEEAFNVGGNLAITPGSVIYENELMQLIQYTPTTNKVYEIPLVIIPPWINKYYILDLQQHNSFVKFLIENGLTVFIISWRNPKGGNGNVSLDDYVAKGALKAIDIALNISESKKVNMLGYCLGGTLLSIASAILSAQKHNPINSATFLASMVDFTDIGPMGDVIDGALIRKLERGELLHHGVLNGHDMEIAFNLIRPNDLIWNYVINNYLKGKNPSAFDVIYWTNDNTNLPADMYVYYMKHIILENKLSRKNALRICNTSIDIGNIQFQVFVIGLKEDNISPAVTTFTTTELVNGPVEFILGDSGHVMGVVNPPYKNKYGYYLNGKLGNGFEAWKSSAEYQKGSWWPIWTNKLIKFSGKEIIAPSTMGNDSYTIIEPSPGSFVKEKC
jgi:polyhydroxyalkanoate synthase